MPLSAEQEVIVAEIMQETLSVVQGITLTAAQVAWVSEDIDLWEAKRNSIAVELNGEVSYRTQRLLDEIRRRVRKAYGLPLYSSEVSGECGSFAIPNVPVF
jgi:hypothetical protein